ncbi:MAG: bifunctional UDP-N-acetylglucosamine diphosphorylase/glucosamine-1-phosphate N-acetyltransferase GlmU, partial [Pseudomonadota bacterium]
GTRMRSALPKVLHQVAGLSLLGHALHSARATAPERVIVVTGHGAEAVAKEATRLCPDAQIAHQDQQLGTAHAVDQARAAMAGFSGKAIVLYGDTPFVRPETLQNMLASKADVTVLGFHAADPGRYGRLVMDDQGAFQKIVEAKDASPQELAITLCNSGVVCADADLLFDLIAQVGNANKAGEYYLTDVVALARNAGKSCAVVTCDEAETLGVNSRADLAKAEDAFQRIKRAHVMADGATLIAPQTVFFAHDTVLGQDVIVEPHVVFGPGVRVDTGARIRAFSHLEGAHVAQEATIGPYARLRPGAHLGEQTRVGNFVEIKNAQIAKGAKVNHLAYVGDADVGEAANLGAGTITCNYDGVMKHRTVIGERAFVGSNSALVAPVRVGAEAVIGSGSVITKDVPDAALALGRGEQTNKPGLGRRLMDRLRAIKAKRQG